MFLSKLRPSRLAMAAAAVASVAGMSSASAGDADGRYAVKGMGLLPCKAFVEQAQQGSQEVALTISWLTGYLTAANMLIDNTYDLVSWQGEALLANALASTCSQMPDQPVAAASNSLIQALGPQRITSAEKPERIVVGERKRLLYPTDVRRVQEALKQNGQTITVDGDFGPGTQTALKAFQKSKGLEETGFPDPVTMIALFTGATPGQAPAPAVNQ